MTTEAPVGRVFLTGATGFIGGAVLRELVRRGHHVRVLVRPGSDTRNLDLAPGSDLDPGLTREDQPTTLDSGPGQIERWPGDLTDREAIARGVAGCDTAYHVGAMYSLWNPRPREIYRANVDGTRNLLDAALKHRLRKVVYTGTVGTLRLPPDGRPANETMQADLRDLHGHYKRSKWLAQQEVSRSLEAGLPVTTVLPSAPVGPFDLKPTPTGKMVLDFLRGRVPAYTLTGLNLVPVEDCARGHILAAEKGRTGESYILGSENCALREIYATLADLCAMAPPRVRVPVTALVPVSLAGEIWGRLTGREPLVPWEALSMVRSRMHFDSSKAARELGYRPGPVRAALARAALFFYLHDYAAPRDPLSIDRLRSEALAPDVSCHAAIW